MEIIKDSNILFHSESVFTSPVKKSALESMDVSFKLDSITDVYQDDSQLFFKRFFK